MTSHRLEPAPGTTRDVFSRDHAPVLTVDPGDTVTVRSLDASGYLARQTVPGEEQPTMFAEARGCYGTWTRTRGRAGPQQGSSGRSRRSSA